MYHTAPYARFLPQGLGSQLGESALLLQCEHWLEATDPKHRYGSHLRPYYTRWLSQQHDAKQDTLPIGEDFFYWLDEGHGRTVDLEDDGVPRATLEAGRVRYLTYEERERCEVAVSHSTRRLFTDSRRSWLAHCGACSTGGATNAAQRAQCMQHRGRDECSTGSAMNANAAQGP